MFKIIFSDLLQKNKITQARLSKDTGIPEGTISKWKDGIQFPSYKYINILCDYFKVSADYLLERKEFENKYNIENNKSIYGNIGHIINGNQIELEPLELELIIQFKKYSKMEQLEVLKELEQRKNRLEP